MSRGILAYTCGGGIGDGIFLASTIAALRDLDPSREYAMAVSTWRRRAWWEIAVDEAPFQALAEFKASEWTICRCTPWKLRRDEHVVAAHVRALVGKASEAYGIDVSVDLSKVSRIPAWFGPRPPLEPSYVGVFIGERLRPKEWPRSRDLVESLRKMNVRAELSPVSADPMDVVSWIARCSVFVGPDTGLTHLAAALGVSTVILLGGRFTAANFDYPDAAHIVDATCAHAPCLEWTRRAHPHPCLQELPDGSQIPCIAEIDVDRVLAAVIEQLERGVAHD